MNLKQGLDNSLENTRLELLQEWNRDKYKKYN